MHDSDFQHLLLKTPAATGVYLMKDKHGTIIYVGKSNNLKSRIKQYLNKHDARFFVTTGILHKALADIETIVVENEQEALLLENNLIKLHKPKFNINLRDDSQYPVLMIDPQHPFPRLTIKRTMEQDTNHYFGPYSSAASCRETLHFINRHFQLRTCSDQVLRSRKRPCLQYQIKRCPAPCVYPINSKDYQHQVSQVVSLLRGNNTTVISALRKQMKHCSEHENYETAAQIRNRIRAIETSLQRQYIVQNTTTSQDVLGLVRNDNCAEITLLLFRQGKLSARRSFFFKRQLFSNSQLISGFIQQYYTINTDIPSEIIVADTIENNLVLSEWLSKEAKNTIRITVPKQGKKLAVLRLAEKNAKASLESRIQSQETAQQIQDQLSLKNTPHHIECYDIAHIQGKHTVASMVTFHQGTPIKNKHRTFNIKTTNNDDPASIYEALYRRFHRAINQPQTWALPDLIVVDGGKSQLHAAICAVEDSNISCTDLEIISIAKKHSESKQADTDRIFLANKKEPIPITKKTPALYWIVQARDEAHRVANRNYANQHRKTALVSELSSISGIGPKRQKQLLRQFGSIHAIKTASLQQLEQTPSMSKTAALAIFSYFTNRTHKEF